MLLPLTFPLNAILLIRCDSTYWNELSFKLNKHTRMLIKVVQCFITSPGTAGGLKSACGLIKTFASLASFHTGVSVGVLIMSLMKTNRGPGPKITTSLVAYCKGQWDKTYTLIPVNTPAKAYTYPSPTHTNTESTDMNENHKRMPAKRV